ncbi:hypothetical protein CN895_23200 [Bacillus cereus]|uniref:hypothetical protein n=1 Tax=Bacillus cereus TaxID=1396 RepID=UPI000BFC347F|nr:hypothetical protein [Bacillus cereus]PGK10558.1 hypothetical protein CN895_23200 [Bacillus cereus]
MSKEFKVHPSEIPNTVTIHVGEMEKCLFAQMLTDFGFGVDVAGDTFQNLYKKGLKKVYNEYYPNDKVY